MQLKAWFSFHDYGTHVAGSAADQPTQDPRRTAPNHCSGVRPSTPARLRAKSRPFGSGHFIDPAVTGFESESAPCLPASRQRLPLAARGSTEPRWRAMPQTSRILAPKGLEKGPGKGDESNYSISLSTGSPRRTGQQRPCGSRPTTSFLINVQRRPPQTTPFHCSRQRPSTRKVSPKTIPRFHVSERSGAREGDKSCHVGIDEL